MIIGAAVPLWMTAFLIKLLTNSSNKSALPCTTGRLFQLTEAW
ncbi:hypothetical protein CY0110_15667 [Crocosphaera chwakensis CCY0110]|uniref:Uncharacterized protein n=1 Tax=Crocosphaera chwakensis CCY0110 TaxID=391612 RepID=A3IHG5_9CHRO|nr:hypothetical protein CY0110_15667 [Crocosphaera chwakensis CCY0110]